MSLTEPNSRLRFISNLMISTLLSLLFLLLALHFAGYLNSVEKGVYLGFNIALMAWLAFIISISANVAIFSLIVLRSRSISFAKAYNRHKSGFVASFLILITIILILQFWTPYFKYLESGVSDGIAPPILLTVAPILSLIAIISVLLYSWRIDASKFTSEEYFELKQRSKADKSAHVFGTTQEEEEHYKQSVHQLKSLVSFIDSYHQTKELKPEIEYNNDLLQVKRNIERWILDTIGGSGSISKARLTSEFEKQFPKTLVALFNSVLYDLIYKDELEMVKDNEKIIVRIKRYNN